MALDFDDLIATMKGSGIGQEACDLRALHAHLSQTLFLPQGQSQAGLPTPQSSFYTSNNPPPPPSSLTSTASNSYNMNNTSTSYHPSSINSNYDGGGSKSFQRSYDAGGAGSRGPIPERGFPSSNGSPFGHHQTFASSPSASGSSPHAHHPSSGSNAFEHTAPPTLPFGRQTRSQTRSAASQTITPPEDQHDQQTPFPGMNFQSGHGPGGGGGGGGGNERRSWAPPPTPRSLSLVRGGGGGSDDVEMGA